MGIEVLLVVLVVATFVYILASNNWGPSDIVNWIRDKREEALERKEVAEQRAAEMHRFKVADNTPVKSVLLSVDERTTSKKGTLAAASRSLVGGALFGYTGALVGAATTGAKTWATGHEATFLVTYKTGRKDTETVDVKSERFYELVEVLEK